MNSLTKFSIMEVKSFQSKDEKVRYCSENSLRLNDLQLQLQNETLAKAERSFMLGAPEIFQLCSNLIRLIKGKRCLDVGTFTGASALAWALATPEDGQVITMDVSNENYKEIGQKIISQSPVAQKITIKIQPATQTLDELISNGGSGKFDFAFIDADKENYPIYYEKCLQLIRSGGIIAIDNAYFYGTVLDPNNKDGIAVDSVNKKIHKDERVDCSLLTTGDALMLAFKK